MAKQDLKGALGASLRAEQEAVVERFAKAESYFNAREQGLRHSSGTPSREKVIRDGFTMPASDYGLIAQVQATSLQAGLSVTKSEVLRAGLHALSQMSLPELKQVLSALKKVKAGRPAK
jgi:hypothetical protein